MPIFRMRLIQCTAVALVMSFASLANAEEWLLELHEDGVKHFTKQSAESPVKSFKTITVVKANLSSLVALLNDNSQFPEWMHKTLEVEKIRDISSQESLVYHVFDAPWPAKDQDNVLYSKWSQDPETLIVTKKIISEPQYINEFKNRQRQQFFNAQWQLKPIGGGEIEVTYTAEIHPGTEARDWMVQLLAYEMPFKTMKNLRQLSLNGYKKARFAYVREPSVEGVAMAGSVSSTK